MFQHTGMELGDNLKITMANALNAYEELNKALPERIIVFRDGVGDGQVSCSMCSKLIILQWRRNNVYCIAICAAKCKLGPQCSSCNKSNQTSHLILTDCVWFIITVIFIALTFFPRTVHIIKRQQ